MSYKAKRPPSIGEYVRAIGPARRRSAQLELQEVAAWRAYASIRANLESNTAPAVGTFMRALYDEHLHGIERGALKTVLP